MSLAAAKTAREEFAGEEAVEAGLFGERDELIWRDEAALRMLPASEGFEAAEEAGAELYKRLKVRNDLVVFEGSAEIVCVVSRPWKRRYYGVVEVTS